MGRQNRDKDTMGERLIAIVAAALRVPRSKLTLETGPGDLEAWDSLAQINVVSEIEAEFGVSIPIEQVAEIRHIRDFLDYIEKTP
jgi:acyl carrier protein